MPHSRAHGPHEAHTQPRRPPQPEGHRERRATGDRARQTARREDGRELHFFNLL